MASNKLATVKVFKIRQFFLVNIEKHLMDVIFNFLLISKLLKVKINVQWFVCFIYFAQYVTVSE
jgi:hypothetical protein